MYTQSCERGITKLAMFHLTEMSQETKHRQAESSSDPHPPKHFGIGLMSIYFYLYLLGHFCHIPATSKKRQSNAILEILSIHSLQSSTFDRCL
jgi:hypothetical protein